MNNSSQPFEGNAGRWNEEKEKSLKIIKENGGEQGFPVEIRKMLTSAISDFSNKKVLIPSSGDNFAAFAFALLKADVTSTDLCPDIIEAAKKRAKEHGFDNIEFRVSDTMTLNGITDNQFDLVFTSNGVYRYLWDIGKTHNAFYRVLKPDGIYCFYEIHPFYSLIDEDVDYTSIPYKGTGKLSFRIEKYKTQTEQDTKNNFYTIEKYVKSLLDARFRITDYCDVYKREEAIPILSCNKAGVDFIITSKFPPWIGLCAQKAELT